MLFAVGPSHRSDLGGEIRGDVINTMSREELMAVNGIGPASADKIISERPFPHGASL